MRRPQARIVVEKLLVDLVLRPLPALQSEGIPPLLGLLRARLSPQLLQSLGLRQLLLNLGRALNFSLEGQIGEVVELFNVLLRLIIWLLLHDCFGSSQKINIVIDVGLRLIDD